GMSLARRHALSASTLCALALLIGACRTAAVYNPTDIALVSPQPLSIEGVSAVIDRAARLQGWQVENLQPGSKLASKSRGRAIATATIVYDTRAFSIQLRSSVGLRQSGDKIHKLYNKWVEALETTILQESAAPQ
ncbi:MAG: hypothetical protein ACREI8_05205, partial [Myxococcota bacterium]